MQGMKLGRRSIRHDRRTLQLGRYTVAGLAPPPVSIDWTKGVANFGMLMNDILGDCTIAGVAHATQVFSLNATTEMPILDSQVLAAYEQWCGYNPADPSTDRGGVELDVLNDWRHQGFAGQALDAYVAVPLNDTELLKQSIALFGGCYIGLEVPNYVMDEMPGIWDIQQKDTGLAGGHCVFVTGYDIDTIDFISWGAVYKMTWAFWAKYVDECYALLGAAFFTAAGVDPSGFNLAQLNADLMVIAHGSIMPGSAPQFTATLLPVDVVADPARSVWTINVDASFAKIAVSADGLTATVGVAELVPLGTQVVVTWTYTNADATTATAEYEFTVGG